MKKGNLIPLVLFCVVFLAYSIYFVKVINTTEQLEQSSIAKTVKRVIENSDLGSGKEEWKLLDQPVSNYVNSDWLNMQKEPSLLSPVVKKVFQNDQIMVLGYPSVSWAFIQAGIDKGYVARRYLSEKPSEVIKSVPDDVPAESAVSGGDYRIPIVTYHHITDDVSKYGASLALPEVNLIAQLDYLVANGYQTYTFHDLEKIAAGKMKASDKAVVLTFNGGYDDAYQASQHLNGKGLKGVFYVTTEKVSTPGYLDWRQIKNMDKWGMEIGSHGVKGVNLTATGEYYVQDELERSKAVLEKEIKQDVVSFAYMEGAYSSEVMNLAKQAGYSFAKSFDSGSVYSSNSFYKLPTLRVFFPAGAKQFEVWFE